MSKDLMSLANACAIELTDKEYFEKELIKFKSYCDNVNRFDSSDITSGDVRLREDIPENSKGSNDFYKVLKVVK